MEGKTEIKEAKKIMGDNFIGKEELFKISKSFEISVPQKKIPSIPFKKDYLKKIRKDYILILGLNKDSQGRLLTINKMREIFGFNPEKSEPCFYNQDWYLKEKFATKEALKFKWYLVRKNIDGKTRGKNPEKVKESFPSAVLLGFVFFAYYLCNNKVLWKNDFIWCKDKDSNGDRIYVGRYADFRKINKNGFNIHRHLTINRHYGFAPEIK